MSIFRDPIISDLKKIKKLSEKVHNQIEDVEIDKAKKKIKSIIKLILDKYERIKDKFSDEILLKECTRELQNAKKALMDLDSFDLFDEAKQLIDIIIKFQEHEIIEIKEDEKLFDDLYKLWLDKYHNKFLYHGTSSIAIDKIKRYGLVPGMVPWDKSDFKRINYLFEKTKNWISFCQWYKQRNYSNKGDGIFLTIRKETATNYSELGGELLNSFINRKYAINKQKDEALLELFKSIIYWAGLDDDLRDGKILQQFKTNRKYFINFVYGNSKLSQGEINELLGYFNKYYNLLSDSKSVVLTISNKLPEFLENCPSFKSYKTFKKVCLVFSHPQKNLEQNWNLLDLMLIQLFFLILDIVLPAKLY